MKYKVIENYDKESQIVQTGIVQLQSKLRRKEWQWPSFDKLHTQPSYHEKCQYNIRSKEKAEKKKEKKKKDSDRRILGEMIQLYQSSPNVLLVPYKMEICAKFNFFYFLRRLQPHFLLHLDFTVI